MPVRAGFGLAVLFAVSLTVGCSMTGPTVRGQAPDNSGPIIGTAPAYGTLKHTPYAHRNGAHDFKALPGIHDNNLGYEGGFYAGPDGTITDRNTPYTVDGQGGGGECPYCQNGGSCPSDGCRRCGRGCMYKHGMPQHYQTYQYDWPKNPVYPQQGVPSGMVQYPYYTLRGPTDFFMTKNIE